MKYLIFNNPEDAYNRSDEAGESFGLLYHQVDADGNKNENGCRYLWPVFVEHKESSPRAALCIEGSEDQLSETEISQLQDELPENWQSLTSD